MDNDDKTQDAVITEEQLSTFRPAKPAVTKGRLAGLQHLKPMNIEDFIVKHNCVNMMLEHPWIRELKLVANPYMYRSYGRANYKSNTVELSERIMKEPGFVQREVFIRAVCHFIAKKLFDEAGEGPAYRLIVQRYMRRPRGQSNSTGNVVPQTKEIETVE